MQAPIGSNHNARPLVNYVAGLGRGATGFTTRSDTGPAHVLVVGNQDGFDENQKFDEFEGNCLLLLLSIMRTIRKLMRYEMRLINGSIVEGKIDLGTLSDAKWDEIPEIGDYSLRNKKKMS
ncbi:protein stabilized1 [Tanacetum coccineum]